MVRLEILNMSSGFKKFQPLIINDIHIQFYSALYSGTGHGGKPIDDLDELCRQWSKCRTCEALSTCDGDLDLNYTPTFAFDVATLTLVTTCSAMNECTTENNTRKFNDTLKNSIWIF